MQTDGHTSDPGCPQQVSDFADQAVEYVRRALGVTLEYNSETLSVLDHYILQVPEEPIAARALVILTSGAYYGEVVRRALGGSWLTHGEPEEWRVELPGGLSFAPAGFVAAAMAQSDVTDYDTIIEAPPRMKELFESALEQMAPVTEAEYYSLAGRLDTLEHVQDVIYAVAQAKAAERGESLIEDEADE